MAIVWGYPGESAGRQLDDKQIIHQRPFKIHKAHVYRVQNTSTVMQTAQAQEIWGNLWIHMDWGWEWGSRGNSVRGRRGYYWQTGFSLSCKSYSVAAWQGINLLGPPGMWLLLCLVKGSSSWWQFPGIRWLRGCFLSLQSGYNKQGRFHFAAFSATLFCSGASRPSSF